MPRDAMIAKNTPPLVADFAVQRADGADLALRFYQLVAIDGDMPDGGRSRVQIAVASIPALLTMKGYAEGHLAKISAIQAHPSCRFHLAIDFPAYAGTGLRRRSSIRLRIFRNSSLGTATSANWNVT